MWRLDTCGRTTGHTSTAAGRDRGVAWLGLSLRMDDVTHSSVCISAFADGQIVMSHARLKVRFLHRELHRLALHERPFLCVCVALTKAWGCKLSRKHENDSRGMSTACCISSLPHHPLSPRVNCPTGGAPRTRRRERADAAREDVPAGAQIHRGHNPWQAPGVPCHPRHHPPPLAPPGRRHLHRHPRKHPTKRAPQPSTQCVTLVLARCTSQAGSGGCLTALRDPAAAAGNGYFSVSPGGLVTLFPDLAPVFSVTVCADYTT